MAMNQRYQWNAVHAGSSLAQRSSACFVSMTAKFNLIFPPNPIPDMGQHFTLSAGPVQIMGQHVLPRLYGCRRL